MTSTQDTPQEQRTVVFHRRGTPHTVNRLGLPLDEAAAMVGVSYNTLWRAVRDNQFPGVKIRDRIVIPLRAVEMLFEAATATGEFVDAADWTAHWTASLLPGEAAA